MRSLFSRNPLPRHPPPTATQNPRRSEQPRTSNDPFSRARLIAIYITLGVFALLGVAQVLTAVVALIYKQWVLMGVALGSATLPGLIIIMVFRFLLRPQETTVVGVEQHTVDWPTDLPGDEPDGLPEQTAPQEADELPPPTVAAPRTIQLRLNLDEQSTIGSPEGNTDEHSPA